MRVLWTRGARTDLIELMWHISQDRPETASRVGERIRAATRRLRDQPQVGRVVPEFEDPRIREVVEYPYRIVYLYSGTSLKVLGIVHSRRSMPDLSHR